MCICAHHNLPMLFESMLCSDIVLRVTEQLTTLNLRTQFYHIYLDNTSSVQRTSASAHLPSSTGWCRKCRLDNSFNKETAARKTLPTRPGELDSLSE